MASGTALVSGACTTGHRPTSARLPDFPVASSQRRLFDPEEQVMGLYGATLPALAAAISTADGRVGWMSGGFWRPAGVPTNARTQENVATLAWFYSQDRPWNPYHRSPQLLALLDSSLGYYFALQRGDGAFPEGPAESPRAATGFALIYLSQTYLLMQEVPWDDQVRRELLARLLRAADWFLEPTNDDVWESAIYTSNQVVAGLLGAFMVADRLGVDRLARLRERLDLFLSRSVSPAGYLYEDRSVDFGYTIGVALGDLALLHGLIHDARLTAVAARFLDFCSYNYLWEPDGSGFVVNGGIGSRQAVTFLDAERTDERSVIDLLALVADDVPAANAFLSTAEGRADLRAAWAQDPAPIPALEPGRVDPTRPRTVLAAPRFPSRRTRLEAVASLRYRAESDFVEERHDPRFDQHFVWIRRPGYFTSAFWGQRRGRQQSGLGFFYHREAGTFVCSQAGPHLSWGAAATGLEEAEMTLAGQLHSSGEQAGPRLALQSSDGNHRRTLVCHADRLDVSFSAPGVFVEHLPLVLQPSDQVFWRLGDGRRIPAVAGGRSVGGLGLEVLRGQHRLVVALAAPTALELRPAPGSLFKTGSRSTALLQITGSTQLAYQLQVTG